MEADFLYLYPNSRAEARRQKETQMHEDSFRENVRCARAIEQAVQEHFDESSGVLKEGSAQSVLEEFGFTRVNFVLANSLKELKKSACGHLVSDAIYQWGQGTFVPPDGKYNCCYAVDTAAQLLEGFIGQVREAYQVLGLFGLEHCVGKRHEQDFKDKVLVMNPHTLRESFWSPKNMLWYGEGGFGCSPESRGRAVYATCLGDGEKTRWNRDDFLGVLDEQYLPDWAREKLEELRGPNQEPNCGPVADGFIMQ